MQLKQGFGRLIRTKTDKGCVFLLDSRVASYGYGKVFLKSLPDPPVYTSGYEDCIANAREFMSESTADKHSVSGAEAASEKQE